MIPTAYVWIDHLPLSPNGKLDRRRLPAPTAGRPGLDQSYTAPRTAVEATLARIWQDVLQIDQIGIHDNSSSLGGHSLLATQVASRIRDTLHHELPLRQLFEHPTIHTLATTIVDAVAERVQAGSAALILDEIEQLPDVRAAALHAELATVNGHANQILEDA
jgi:hypothetical protein